MKIHCCINFCVHGLCIEEPSASASVLQPALETKIESRAHCLYIDLDDKKTSKFSIPGALKTLKKKSIPMRASRGLVQNALMGFQFFILGSYESLDCLER